MTADNELQIVLRTIAQTQGATQVRDSLRQVRTEAQATKQALSAGQEFANATLRQQLQGAGATAANFKLASSAIRQQFGVAPTLTAADLGITGGRAVQGVHEVAASTQEAHQSFQVSANSALRFGASLLGLGIGLSAASAAGHLISSTLGEARDAAIAADRATRALGASYGSGAVEALRFGAALSHQAGLSTTTVQQALVQARPLTTQFGLSDDQTQQLVKRSADLAAATGQPFDETFKRVLGGVASGGNQLSEYGVRLDDVFVKTVAYNGALSGTFDRMTAAQQAGVRFELIMSQTSETAGKATESQNTLTGAIDRMGAAADNARTALGKMLEPGMITAANAISEALGGGNVQEIGAREAERNRLEIGKLIGQVGITQNAFGVLADASTGKMVTVEEVADRLHLSWDDLLSSMRDNKFTGSAQGLELVRKALEELNKASAAAGGAGGSGGGPIAFIGPQAASLATILANTGQQAASAQQRLAALQGTLLNVADASKEQAGAMAGARAELTFLAREEANRNQAGGGGLANQLNVALQQARTNAEREQIQTRIDGLQQLEGAFGRLGEAERVQADLQRQSIALSAQQAAAELSALPATNALSDIQNRIARDQLIASDRLGQSADARAAARRDLRLAGRLEPGVELGALDALAPARLAGRDVARNALLSQIAAGAVAAREQATNITVNSPINLTIQPGPGGAISDDVMNDVLGKVAAAFSAARRLAENAAAPSLAGVRP